MRFVQPAVLLLGVGMYVAIIIWVMVWLPQDSGGPGDLIWIVVVIGAWNLVMLVATIIAIVDCVLRARASRTAQLAVDAMIVKLASIPFFLVNFAVLELLFNAGIVLFFITPILWTIVAIGIVLTYLTMLSTSIPVWATIAQLRQDRSIGTGLTVLYAILSLMFVTDVATGVLLFGHSRRRPRTTLVWLLLATGAAIAVIGVLEFFFGILSITFPVVKTLLLWAGADWLVWFIPIVVGIAVMLATGIVGVVRRSNLRDEIRAARAVSAPIESDASDQDSPAEGSSITIGS